MMLTWSVVILILYLFSFSVWHYRLRLLCQSNREEPARRSEVYSHARGDTARRSRAVFHGGQRALLPRSCGRSAGQRHALSHHLSSHRYSTSV